MKIALLHFNACPFVDDSGGLVQEHVRLLKRNGHTVTLGCLLGTATRDADAFIPFSLNGSSMDFVVYLSSALSGTDCVWFYGDPFEPLLPALGEALAVLPSHLTSARWIYWALSRSETSPRSAEVCAGLVRGRGWEWVADAESLASILRKQGGGACRIIPRGVDLGALTQPAPRLALLAENLGWWDADLVLFHPSHALLEEDFVEMLSEVREACRSGLDLKYIVTFTHALEGDGTGLARYVDLVRTFQLEKQVFLEGRPQCLSAPEARAFLEICDAVVLPSDFGGDAGEAAFLDSLGRIGKPAFKLGCQRGADTVGLTVSGLIHDLNQTPESSVDLVIRQLMQSETIQARRRTLRDTRWQSIYHNLIEDLLLQPPILNLS